MPSRARSCDITPSNSAKIMAFTLPFRESKLCPVTLLQLDLTNPRLQTGTDIAVKDDSELIAVLCDIAALDELVTSICTNTYLNLEPMIVIGKSDSGPFSCTVLTILVCKRYSSTDIWADGARWHETACSARWRSTSARAAALGRVPRGRKDSDKVGACSRAAFFLMPASRSSIRNP